MVAEVEEVVVDLEVTRAVSKEATAVVDKVATAVDKVATAVVKEAMAVDKEVMAVVRVKVVDLMDIIKVGI